MRIGNIKRKHVRVTTSAEAPHVMHNGKRLRMVIWNGIATNLTLAGSAAFDGPEPLVSKCLYKGRGEAWYVTPYAPGKIEFEGPYEFDQLLTLLALEGYTEAY